MEFAKHKKSVISPPLVGRKYHRLNLMWIKTALIHLGGDITDQGGGYHRPRGGGISPTKILKKHYKSTRCLGCASRPLAYARARVRQTVLKLNQTVFQTAPAVDNPCGQPLKFTSERPLSKAQKFRPVTKNWKRTGHHQFHDNNS